MDFSTIVGIIAAFGLMISAIMTGGGMVLFINIPSAIIVIGGTLGATLVHYPFGDVFKTFSILKKAFFHKSRTSHDIIKQMVGFATKARKEGILSLQSVIDKVDDRFMKKALQNAVDGQEPDSLKHLLQTEINYIEERHDIGANIFIAMGTYAPAMGMIGTLIGLVQMLQTMSDPSTIGPAMAIALLTTFYGAIIANVICMPIAGKLRKRSGDEVLSKTLIAEGMRCVLSGENPRIMEQHLHAFIAPNLRKSSFEK